MKNYNHNTTHRLAIGFSFIVLLFLPQMVSAQIEIHDSGRINIGGGLFSPQGAAAVIRCESNCSNLGRRFGIYTDIKGTSSNSDAIGVKGISIASATEEANIGVWGRGGNAYDEMMAYGFNAGIKGTVEGSVGDRWGGYFNGDVYTTGSYEPSDERLKENMIDLDKGEMLSGILQLNPFRYHYLSPDELEQRGLPRLVASEGEQLGLSAQELEAVFPEMVLNISSPLDYRDKETSSLEERYTMTKAVNYNGLIPVLIAGIQEQQAQIEELEARIEALENMMQD